MKFLMRLILLLYLIIVGVGAYKLGDMWFCVLCVLLCFVTITWPRFGATMIGALLGWLLGSLVGVVLAFVLYPFSEMGLALMFLFMSFSLSTIETIPVTIYYSCCTVGAILGTIIGWDLGGHFK